MSGVIGHHEVHSPASLGEALAFLHDRAGEGWQPLAGGTDLLVGTHVHGDPRARWLNLWGLRRELSGISRDGEWVRVGGLATMTELRRSPVIAAAAPLLAAAAATVGASQIQNRATLAGNLANSSPAGDTLPVLAVLEADLELASVAGARMIPYSSFATGYRRTALRDDELLTAVRFRPLPGGSRILFRKVGTRAAQAISKVVLAAVSTATEHGRFADVRLAFGSVAPTTIRAHAAEAAVRGQLVGAEAAELAVRALDRDLSPIDDVRSTAQYRRQVATSLVREFLRGTLGTRFAAE